LAARVNGREVDLAFTLDAQQNVEALAIETRSCRKRSKAWTCCGTRLRICSRPRFWICFPAPNSESDRRCWKTRATDFFYDVIAPQPLTEADLPVIEKRMRQIASRNLAYRREEIPKLKRSRFSKSATNR